MADMNTTISDLAAAIAQDTTIDTWCRLEYDTGLTVLENCDALSDPGESDCPLLILFPMSRSGGINEPVKRLGIGMAVIVFDDGKPESIDQVVRFTGGRNVDTLRGYIVDVIQSNIPAGLHLSAIQTEYETIGEFPFVTANMAMEFTQTQTIGTDPFE